MRIYNKFLRIYYELKKSKFLYSFPKKNDLIILDDGGVSRIKSFLIPNCSFTVLHDREKKYYLPILIIAIINMGKSNNFIESYIKSFIKYVGAKFALTYNDNRLYYANVINSINHCKLAFIQNGRRTEGWSDNLSKNDKFKFDYYFTHHKAWSDYASHYVDAKFIEIGHITANYFEPARFKKIKKIQWISEWRNIDIVSYRGKRISFNNHFYKPSHFTLKIIEKFCLDNNLKFEIIGCDIDNHELEKEYYSSFTSNFKFLRRIDIYSSHNYLSNDAIICAHNSTLLHEAFGRGFRTAFFSIRGHYIDEKSWNFGWPKIIDDEGKFWCNKPNASQFNKILNYLIDVGEKGWRKDLNTYKNYIMEYNHNNSEIKKILRAEGFRIT